MKTTIIDNRGKELLEQETKQYMYVQEQQKVVFMMLDETNSDEEVVIEISDTGITIYKL